MSTLENTVSMMKTLPEADLLKIQKLTLEPFQALPETDLLEIQNLTQKLFQRRESEAIDRAVGKFLKPMSREDFMRDIDTAEQEIVDGKYRSADEVFNGLERKYGL